MRYLLLFMHVLLVGRVTAQGAGDVLEMKDGSVYQGLVSSYHPGGETIIKLVDGRLHAVHSDSIVNLTVAEERIVNKQFDIRQRGYFHQFTLGLLAGRSQNGPLQITTACHALNGYRINGHHLSAGLGVEKHLGNWYLPIYADYAYHFVKGHTTPVLGVNGGAMVPLGNTSYDVHNYSRGAFVGARLGVISYHNPHVAVFLDFTYRHLFFQGADYTTIEFWGVPRKVTGSAALHRFWLMVGVRLK